jgi:transcription elongation factor GreA
VERLNPFARIHRPAILLRSLKPSAGDIPARSGVLYVADRNTNRDRESMPKDVILTPEGLQKLNDELELLSTEKRREVAERIKEAREFGDISENSEYDDAKNEQAMVESRIAQLQEKLRMATVIQAKDLSTDVVQVGSVVHVKDEKTGKSVKYTIVGSAEAKPNEYKLSNESPVGRALLGHKRNDTVAVKVPRGPARKLKITKIDVGLE